MSVVEKALSRLRAAGEAKGGVLDAPGAGERLADPGQGSPEAVDSSLPLGAMPKAGDQSGTTCVIDPLYPIQLGQFRMLKRRVLDAIAARRKAGQSSLIAVSSACPGDGKSFVSLNLAIIASLERDVAVTLVDFDCFRRRTSASFGLRDARGFVEELSENPSPDFRRVEHAVENSRLRVIPAGRPLEGAQELLTSTAAEALIDAMRSHRQPRLFVFDCPPILATDVSVFLLRRCDLGLFVVRAEETKAPAVRESLAAIGADAPIAIVMNGGRRVVDEKYYGYGTVATEQPPSRG